MKLSPAKARPSWSEYYANDSVSPPRKLINIYPKLIQLTVFSHIIDMYTENHKKHQRTMTFLKYEL